MILHQLDLITRYIYANGQKISSWTRYRYRQTGRLDGNTKEDVPLGEFFYHDNHLGSSVLITDKNGKEKTHILYKPFGEIDQSHSVGLNATTMKFTSQEYDEESELYYLSSRFYDPSLGRFLNPDSIVPDWYDSQAFNRYAYSYNNPVLYIDPSGHIPETLKTLIDIGADGVGPIRNLEGEIVYGQDDPQVRSSTVNTKDGPITIANFHGTLRYYLSGQLYHEEPGLGPGDEIDRGMSMPGVASNLKALVETGKYKKVKGHHVHAKAGFKDNINYDLKLIPSTIMPLLAFDGYSQYG